MNHKKLFRLLTKSQIKWNHLPSKCQLLGDKYKSSIYAFCHTSGQTFVTVGLDVIKQLINLTIMAILVIDGQHTFSAGLDDSVLGQKSNNDSLLTKDPRDWPQTCM